MTKHYLLNLISSLVGLNDQIMFANLVKSDTHSKLNEHYCETNIFRQVNIQIKQTLTYIYTGTFNKSLGCLKSLRLKIQFQLVMVQ